LTYTKWQIPQGSCVCVCVVWVRYERLTVNFKDLQTTLSLALIEAFPNFDVPFIILW
jgi:hypothetical protein